MYLVVVPWTDPGFCANYAKICLIEGRRGTTDNGLQDHFECSWYNKQCNLELLQQKVNSLGNLEVIPLHAIRRGIVNIRRELFLSSAEEEEGRLKT